MNWEPGNSGGLYSLANELAGDPAVLDLLPPFTAKASFIQTVSGQLINPLEPEARLISIDDIAHSLSNQGRFTGHTASPCWWWPNDLYSVAEHSVHVAELTPEPYKLCGLLHDAGETYMSDIASPVKHHEKLALYREAEGLLWLAVARRFGLPFIIPSEVHVADRYMLGIEARDLMRGCEGIWWRDVVAPVVLHPLSVARPWSPRKARRKFLEMYNRLAKETLFND